MGSHILALETETPEFFLTQELIAEKFIELFSLKGLIASKVRELHKNSGVHKRYAVMVDMAAPIEKRTFLRSTFLSDPLKSAAINDIYREEAPLLATKVVRKVLDNWGGSPKDITHIISVSCTGMYAPGIEFDLMEALDLRPDIQRFGVNFMGCFGAFKGLALANALAGLDKKNKVLVVCTELCSLHLQPTLSMEAFVSNSLFADGAAAVIVGEPDDKSPSLWEIEKSVSYGLPSTKDKMSWHLGDTGFIMGISKEVPDLLSANIKGFVDQFALDQNDVEWAIHPGGRAIIEKVEKALSISPEDNSAARETLRDYGNMSSGTFLFILKNLLKKERKPWCVGLGMGPGLSIEGILLKGR